MVLLTTATVSLLFPSLSGLTCVLAAVFSSRNDNAFLDCRSSFLLSVAATASFPDCSLMIVSPFFFSSFLFNDGCSGLVTVDLVLTITLGLLSRPDWYNQIIPAINKIMAATAIFHQPKGITLSSVSLR